MLPTRHDDDDDDEAFLSNNFQTDILDLKWDSNKHYHCYSNGNDEYSTRSRAILVKPHQQMQFRVITTIPFYRLYLPLSGG